ncbi:MAG: S24/S26 family peptidase, partial [Paludibacteraceae bacterium]|nr:S24/S26 family peptidase [Paludibacteraceae bacterium]
MIVPNDILFSTVREYIKEGKEVMVTAKGNSMLPFIRTGDVVTLCKAHRLRTGMVVLVEPSEGVYILHRIVKL